MKRITAIAGALAFASWLASCTDTPTEPGLSSIPELDGPSYSVDSRGFVLYAGTSYPGMVYGYDGSNWVAISGALGDAVLDIVEFGGDLYAAGFESYATGGPGMIWRYNGSSWDEVFRGESGENQVADLEVWGGGLYAGTVWAGGELLRYNSGSDAFDILQSSVGSRSPASFSGIRSVHAWSETPLQLHLGDATEDIFGRWDGTDFFTDYATDGSCIFDFVGFNGRLYAAAYGGRLWWSNTGTDWQRIPGSVSPFGLGHIWELEVLHGLLFAGTEYGRVYSLTPGHSATLVWSTGTWDGTFEVSAMAVGGDLLFMGTGREAGYWWGATPATTNGTARVFAYDDSDPVTPVVEIFDADGGDTGGTDHAGIQVLYVPSTPPPPTNEPPVAEVYGPYLGAAGTAIDFDGTGSSDPDGDILTYSWDFGDGYTGSGPTPSHSFAAAGIYDVCLTVNDGTVDSDAACTIAVVYDPSAGFVTGGGWIESLAGAYVPDPALTGKASFGFVAKYKKGAQTPDGNTEFQFRTAGLNFHSSAYEWLVVNRNSANAQFKGTGTVNGAGDYKFMIWAEDGTPDMFRIRIWEEDGSGVESTVYDNGAGQAISGGSIVVHTK